MDKIVLSQEPIAAEPSQLEQVVQAEPVSHESEQPIAKEEESFEESMASRFGGASENADGTYKEEQSPIIVSPEMATPDPSGRQEVAEDPEVTRLRERDRLLAEREQQDSLAEVETRRRGNPEAGLAPEPLYGMPDPVVGYLQTDGIKSGIEFVGAAQADIEQGIIAAIQSSKINDLYEDAKNGVLFDGEPELNGKFMKVIESMVGALDKTVAQTVNRLAMGFQEKFNKATEDVWHLAQSDNEHSRAAEKGAQNIADSFIQGCTQNEIWDKEDQTAIWNDINRRILAKEPREDAIKGAFDDATRHQRRAEQRNRVSQTRDTNLAGLAAVPKASGAQIQSPSDFESWGKARFG